MRSPVTSSNFGGGDRFSFGEVYHFQFFDPSFNRLANVNYTFAVAVPLALLGLVA